MNGDDERAEHSHELNEEKKKKLLQPLPPIETKAHVQPATTTAAKATGNILSTKAYNKPTKAAKNNASSLASKRSPPS